MPLAPAERSKLARVLGLLGSPHQGEVIAAAAAADRLVRGRGLDWADVLGGAIQQATPAPPEWTHRHSVDHWANLKTCGDHPDQLTTWERQYVASIWYLPRPSAKQKRVLADIASKVRAAGPRAG